MHDRALNDLRVLRLGIKTDRYSVEPRVTNGELAEEMGRLDDEKDGSYNVSYLGHVLNGHEDHRPHTPDYLKLARAALDALLARRHEPSRHEPADSAEAVNP